jgi:hypothetical protein
MTQSRHPVQLGWLLDLATTGFDPGEVDAIMGDFGEDRANPADEPSLRSRK